MPSGEERPVAFASRTLSPAERNYSQIDKEALGIVWSLKKFHSYIYGRNFTLVTDHQPLTAIFSPTKHLPAMTAARLQRYAMFLAGYQYNIVFRKTAEHANADGLSRLPLNATKTDNASNTVDDVDAFHLSQFATLPVTAEQVPQRDKTRHYPSRCIQCSTDWRLESMHAAFAIFHASDRADYPSRLLVMGSSRYCSAELATEGHGRAPQCSLRHRAYKGASPKLCLVAQH